MSRKSSRDQWKEANKGWEGSRGKRQEKKRENDEWSRRRRGGRPVRKGKRWTYKRERSEKKDEEKDRERDGTRMKVSLTISSSLGSTGVWVWSPASGHPCIWSSALFWCTCTCRLLRKHTLTLIITCFSNRMNLQCWGFQKNGNWAGGNWTVCQIIKELPPAMKLTQTLKR